MPVEIEVSGVIDRPVADVFHFYAHEHVRNHPRWDPDMQLEQISDGPIGVGTIIRRRNTHSGTPVEGTMEIVEFEPERAFGVVIHDGPTETHGRVTFEAEAPERTTLTISAEFQALDESKKDWITGLVERSVHNIKQLIESEALGARMADPIAFIIRNRIKEGMLDAFTQHYLGSIPSTEADKPGTLVQLAYLNEDATEVDIVRVFPSAEAMDLHLQGADQRSKAAYRFIEPTSIEIYGTPSTFAMQMMKKVTRSGIHVRVHPRYIGGFVRPQSGEARAPLEP